MTAFTTAIITAETMTATKPTAALTKEITTAIAKTIATA